MAYRGTPPREMRKSAETARKSTDWGFASTGSADGNAPGSWSRPSLLAAMAGRSGGDSETVILGKPVVHQGYLAKRGEKSQTNAIARMVIPQDQPHPWNLRATWLTPCAAHHRTVARGMTQSSLAAPSPPAPVGDTLLSPGIRWGGRSGMIATLSSTRAGWHTGRPRSSSRPTNHARASLISPTAPWHSPCPNPGSAPRPKRSLCCVPPPPPPPPSRRPALCPPSPRPRCWGTACSNGEESGTNRHVR